MTFCVSNVFNHRIVGLMYVGTGGCGLGMVDSYRTPLGSCQLSRHLYFSLEISNHLNIYNSWPWPVSPLVVVTNSLLTHVRPQDEFIGQSYKTS